MKLLRWTALGAAAIAVRAVWRKRGAKREAGGNFDGISALFDTRESADRAVEHLVQQHGVERTAIFIEPAAGENSAGTAVSGGDAGSARSRDNDRGDAPLNGALRVTVGASGLEQAAVSRALAEVGATEVSALAGSRSG